MLRIGTSGYSYPDWRSHFYPANLKSSDLLSFYAQEFDTVEINYTFYRMPTAAALAAMAAKVPEGFQFTLKAHREMTHERNAEPAAFAEFRRGIAPLQAQEKLGCVLAQFPTSFHNTAENRAYVREFRQHLGDLPTVVEFRHRSWIQKPVFQWLSELEVGFCCVDQPQFDVLIPPIAVATAPVAYVRFHGRNAAQWWQHEHAHERYDYSYTDAELLEWVPRLQRLQQQAQRVYLFANNCYKSQSVTTARQLKTLLGVETGLMSPQQMTLF